jgi:hypothetical protein
MTIFVFHKQSEMPFGVAPPANKNTWTGENVLRTIDSIQKSEQFVALVWLVAF